MEETARRVKLAEWAPTLKDPIIQTYIRERVGEEALAVAELIETRQPVQGVEILETLNEQKASAVRKILYKLEDAKVAQYQKDTDKSGWETFLWRLTLDDVKFQINKERHKIIMDLEHQLELEAENSFYQCPNRHGRIIFEDGVASKFKCPECNEPLNFADNEAIVKQLEAALQELRLIVY